jgi:2-oxoglutarate dehydrogenase complex dehydrogenase (E1) component-like enzyme
MFRTNVNEVNVEPIHLSGGGRPYLEWALGKTNGKANCSRYAGRPTSASPAVGTVSQHQAQLSAFMEQAFAP